MQNKILKKNLVKQGNNQKKIPKILQKIARLLQGSSKCAAVYIGQDQNNKDILKISRNNITNHSRINDQDSQYMQEIASVVEFLQACVTEKGVEEKQKEALKNIMLSEQKENAATVSKELRKEIASGVSEFTGEKDQYNITKFQEYGISASGAIACLLMVKRLIEIDMETIAKFLKEKNTKLWCAISAVPNPILIRIRIRIHF